MTSISGSCNRRHPIATGRIVTIGSPRLGLDVGPSGHESALEGHLISDAGQAIAGGTLGKPSDFKEDGSRPDDRCPVFRFAFALAHAGFGGDGRDRLMGEDADVIPPFPGDEPRHGDAAALDALGGEPAPFQGLQAEIPVGDVVASVRLALDGAVVFPTRDFPADDAALTFSILDPLGHLWHRRSLPLSSPLD